jgi:hypothetical protein
VNSYVSFLIRLAAFQASGGADTRHLKPFPDTDLVAAEAQHWDFNG